MADYNYASFPLDLEDDLFQQFPSVLKVGGPAPDGGLTDVADGRRVLLSDFWKTGPLVLEFGSIT